MIDNTFNPADAWALATRAVTSFIGKRYAGVFTAEDIEDIVTNVVSKMWEARASFDPAKGKLFSWVWRIAQNATLDAVADKARRRGISGDFEKVGGGVVALPTPDYAADDELILNDTVEHYLGKLKSDRDKRIFLYLCDGLKGPEIAEREGITRQAAYMAVFHLRKFLRGTA